MESVRIWAQASEAFKAVLSLGVIIVPSLLVAYLTLASTNKVVKKFADIYYSFRTFFDEPTDELVMLISEKTGLTPEQVIEHITQNLDKIFPKPVA